MLDGDENWMVPSKHPVSVHRWFPQLPARAALLPQDQYRCLPTYKQRSLRDSPELRTKSVNGLPNNFRSKLDMTRTAGPNYRIGGSNVWSVLRDSESRAVREVVNWISKVRVVEDVEHFATSLQFEPVAKLEELDDREIEIHEIGAVDYIAPHVAEGPGAGGVNAVPPWA